MPKENGTVQPMGEPAAASPDLGFRWPRSSCEGQHTTRRRTENGTLRSNDWSDFAYAPMEVRWKASPAAGP